MPPVRTEEGEGFWPMTGRNDWCGEFCTGTSPRGANGREVDLHRNKPTGCQWALGLLTGRGGLLMLTEAGLRNSLPTWPSKEAA
jgi:hypothetical protein